MDYPWRFGWKAFRPQPHDWEGKDMTLERWIRLIAGTFVLVSLLLSRIHSPYWLLFTAFVGLNLFQSALTNWCLMEDILRKLGVKERHA
jgi:hypothetical protein